MIYIFKLEFYKAKYAKIFLIYLYLYSLFKGSEDIEVLHESSFNNVNNNYLRLYSNINIEK